MSVFHALENSLLDCDDVQMRYVFVLLILCACKLHAQALHLEDRFITVAIMQDPPTLNSIMATDLVSFFVLGHINQGLLRYDRRGRLVPGVAESWDVQPKRIVFRLRQDARWSDGSRITAHDFVFAWRKVNDPKEAAPFSAIMYPIKNAEKVQNGELSVLKLGVSAVDDITLVVELEYPCGYCLSLMPHATFFPVKEVFYSKVGQEYGASPNGLLANGAFQLSEWKRGASLVLSSNQHYWNRDAVWLRKIVVGYITEDNRTRLNLFVDNKIALVKLGAETVNDASARGLRLRMFATGGLAYLRFNVSEDSIFQAKVMRQAVQAVFDPETFVNKVVAIPGYKPAYSFFPSWLRGVNGRFSEEYPVPTRSVDVALGRSLVEGYRTELRVERLPAITILTVASPTGSKVAEYLQGLLKQTLGIDVRVDQQSFRQYLEKSRKTQFDIAVSSWYPDFDDIMTYADLQASWNANNRGKYYSEQYDSILRVLQNTTFQKKRMDAAARLQEILIEDVPVLPTAETGSAYIQHHKLKGVVRRVFGQDPDFTHARIIK